MKLKSEKTRHGFFNEDIMVGMVQNLGVDETSTLLESRSSRKGRLLRVSYDTLEQTLSRGKLFGRIGIEIWITDETNSGQAIQRLTF